ncbi:MAG: hypothetical protein ACOYBC_02795 [Bilifractor sp.]|jgi:hypothetical protein
MKKYKETIRAAMLHIALICGIVILTAGILDWFNPYMNFSGQIRPIEIVQVGALMFLVFTTENREVRVKHRNGKTHMKRQLKSRAAKENRA